MRVGFDIGGTFTDVVFLDDEGRLTTVKLLSVLERLGDDISELLAPARASGSVATFIHGTTIGSNAVIEGTTARFGLITTAGFRDTLEMRGQRRPAIYDVNWDRLPALTPRSLRLEVRERVLADGSVDQALDEVEVETVVRQLVDRGVEAIAVCLVNSYLRPDHERAIGDVIRRVAPDIPMCLASEGFAEIREYERSSTVSVNASLVPIVDRYLTRLERQLEVGRGDILIMQSNGGLMNSVVARERPVLMIESGPAAGVLAAARLAKEVGLGHVLSFDMGGTTAKASMIEGGRPLEKPQSEVGGGSSLATRLFGGEGHVVRVPSLDIVEVGAGGGSLAWIDSGGALRMGPQGAGADPGPVCYGRGGTQPTVTDANVVLGYINPFGIAASTVSIDREAAAAAIQRRVAEPLGLSLKEAAFGMIRVADSTMIRALRAVTIERGVDPRALTLVGYGGSGPVHAARLAENIGISRVYIPMFPGLFSSVGLLLADYRHDAIRSVMQPLAAIDPSAFDGLYRELEAEVLTNLEHEGIARELVTLQREVDMQYQHQNSALTVPLAEVRPGEMHDALRQVFRDAHVAAYGFDRDDPEYAVSVRVRATAIASETRIADLARHLTDQPAPSESGRNAYFGNELGDQVTRILRRADLDRPEEGPLIIEEPDTSVVVPPRWRAARDQYLNLVLTDTRREGSA